MIPFRFAHRRLLTLLLALCVLLLEAAPLAAQEPGQPLDPQTLIPQTFEPVPAGLIAPEGLIDAGVTDARHVALLNHLPSGYGRNIHVRGDYAYTLVDQELVIFDVSDLSRPTLVSFIQLGSSSFAAAQDAESPTAATVQQPQSPGTALGGGGGGGTAVSAITYDGDFAFALMGSEVWTLSLADPTRPVKRQVTRFDDQWPTRIDAQDGSLYVAMLTELRVMAIQSNGKLVKAGSHRLESENSTIGGLLVAHEAAYLSVASDIAYNQIDLLVLDLTDPTAPKLAATLPGQGGYSMLTSADRFYVFAFSPTTGYLELVIYDRSDPHQLVELARVSEGLIFYGVAVAAWDDYLLLSDGFRSQLVDLSVPATPKVTAWTLRVDTALAHGEQLYTLSDGLHIYDVAALPDAVELGTFNFFLSSPIDSHLRDEYALVQDQWGLHILDLSSPLDLVQVAQVPSSVVGSGYSSVIDGDYLYSSSGYLQTITDIADPTRPAVVGFHQGNSGGIFGAKDGIVYLYSYDQSKLLLMDTSTPSLWQELSSLNLTPIYPRVLLTDNRAYLSGSEGLVVVNVADPTQPRRVSTLPEYSGAMLHLIEGDHLYKSNGVIIPSSSNHIDVLDISNRNQPVTLSRYQLDTGSSSTVSDAAYDAPYLYVADTHHGLYVLDAADPSMLLEVGRYLTTGGAYSVAAQETLITVTRYSGGLVLLRLDPPDATSRVEPSGGTLAADGGDVTYSLPNGFASTPISLTHSLRRFGPSSVLPPLAPTGIVFRNSAVDAATGEPVQTAAAYTLTIAIDDISGAFPPETLTLYHWTGEAWAAQASSVDTANRQVTATTDQFGIFALMAEPYQLRLPHVSHHEPLPSAQPELTATPFPTPLP